MDPQWRHLISWQVKGYNSLLNQEKNVIFPHTHTKKKEMLKGKKKRKGKKCLVTFL